MKKSVICVTEISKAYFVIEHPEGVDPMELWRNYYEREENQPFGSWIDREIESGYEGRDTEICDTMTEEDYWDYPNLSYAELTNKEELKEGF